MSKNSFKIYKTGATSPFLTISDGHNATDRYFLDGQDAISGWDDAIDYERNTLENPTGGSFVSSTGRALSRQVSIVFWYEIRLPQEQVTVKNSIYNNFTQNGFYKLQVVKDFGATITTETIDNAYVTSSFKSTTIGKYMKFQIGFSTKRPQISSVTKDGYQDAIDSDVVATKSAIVAYTNNNPLASISQISAQKVETNNNDVSVTRDSSDNGLIIINGSNPGTTYTKNDSVMIDYTKVKNWVDSDVASTKSNIQTLLQTNSNPTQTQLNNQRVQTNGNVITVTKSSSRITISGSNPGYTAYSKEDSIVLGRDGIDPTTARTLVLSNNTVFDNTVFVGGDNRVMDGRVYGAFWHRFVITQPGQYTITQKGSGGDLYLNAFWAPGNIQASFPDPSSAYPKSISPQGTVIFKSDDNNQGTSRGIGTITVTSSTISGSGVPISMPITNTTLPVTIWILSLMYVDSGLRDSNVLMDTTQFVSQFNVNTETYPSWIQIDFVPDTTAQGASATSAQTMSSSSSTNNTGG